MPYIDGEKCVCTDDGRGMCYTHWFEKHGVEALQARIKYELDVKFGKPENKFKKSLNDIFNEFYEAETHQDFSALIDDLDIAVKQANYDKYQVPQFVFAWRDAITRVMHLEYQLENIHGWATDLRFRLHEQLNMDKFQDLVERRKLLERQEEPNEQKPEDRNRRSHRIGRPRAPRGVGRKRVQQR